MSLARPVARAACLISLVGALVLFGCPATERAAPEATEAGAGAEADPPAERERDELSDPPVQVGPTRALPTLAGGPLEGAIAVTHAGVGSPPEHADGAAAGAEAARARLAAGDSALDAAVAGTVVLEDDPRFNAGTGANIRLDGATIQMDASLMTDDGQFAAVGVIERVANPIRVARLVLDSPHVFMAGEGATRFAHKQGIPDVVPESPEARAKYEQRLQRLRERTEADGSTEFDWRAYWNFPGELPEDMRAWKHGGDTVGTVVRTADGRFAATLSTGGTSVTLYGRVGDVPVYGAGTYAGEAGAVACTGDGEEIIRRALARSVYERMAAGLSAKDAVHEAVSAFPDGGAVGVIAVGRDGWGVAATHAMAFGQAAG